jgi:uncharacterized protein (DUF2461 family)
MTFDYETWIKQARNRLELLYQQREAITNEISCLERGLQGFEPLAKAAWIGPAAGVTESIRQILSEAPRRFFSPTQIRDELLEKGVRMRQKNPLATIHQVLARLVEKGTVTVTIRNGVNCYRWIGEDGRDDVLKPATKSK